MALTIASLNVRGLRDNMRTQNVERCLSNGPCKKDSTRGNGMRKGANFCTTLLLFYHTSDWLNQQNLPKLQVAVYLFILN